MKAFIWSMSYHVILYLSIAQILYRLSLHYRRDLLARKVQPWQIDIISGESVPFWERMSSC